MEASGVTGNARTIGAGLEWGGPSALGRTWPFRIGYRRANLPFGPADSDPVESAFSAGIGINLAQVDEFPLASIDCLSLQRMNDAIGKASETIK